ncbi:glycosyltransferase family 39 protein [Methanoregula sp.]|uniref:glycosyltransferase family 39 protein n=1 Tax=Methanoregula sp. TaxID=2052170 RepID=UPI00236F1D89|nr:glycosyltransferase family 39 protein [Methanoregula sp.]MDD1687424.1 glycosyltransferase family 39 protein [Methanoregula sp.]
MTGNFLVQKYRYELLLAGILLLAAFLNIWNIWSQGISNAYYAAAVRSMLENPAMLFFNSFDAAGFITVDKPPVGLWVQAASAALLGFSGWSLVLPQALAGVGSVALVYLIVSRAFGKPAGLVSALALAITPIFVAVSRNGTMDGILIFVLLLAIWIGLKAARESSLPCLLLAVILVGIGFNIKMIQAFIVVPAIIAIYLLGAREISRNKRILHIFLAIAVLVAVSLSWAVAIDMIPADQRPYIGGSGDNTVLGLIVNYNGVHRLESDSTGQGGNPGGFAQGTSTVNGNMPPDSQSGISFAAGDMQNQTVRDNAVGNPMDRTRGADQQPPDRAQDSGMMEGSAMAGMPPSGMNSTTRPGDSTLSAPGNTRGGGMGDETGTPGIARLFSEGLASQISWLLPFTLIGLLALWKRPTALSLKGLEDAGLFREKGLTFMAMGLWLLPGLLYFSLTTGFWHTYYLATIAPPLAALAGIGAVAMYGAFVRGDVRGWVLVAAIAVTGIVQMIFLMYTAEWSGPLVAIVGCGACIMAIMLVILKVRDQEEPAILPKIVAAGAIALLFIAPFVWAFTPMMYGSGNLPTAGPRLSEQGSGGTGMNSMPGSSGNVSNLADYLLSHSTGETWLVAVPSSMSGAELIIGTGKPVMSLGGFAGSDSVLTVTALKNLVDDGKIRYFYLSGGQGGGGSSGNSELFSWVEGACTAVPSSSWGGTSGTVVSDQGTRALSERDNQTFPDIQSAMQDSMPGMSGASGSTAPGSATGNQNSLYDCAGYMGQSVA